MTDANLEDSDYDSESRIYKATIKEPKAGAFGEKACKYVEERSDTYKCIFEYIKTDEKTYCEVEKEGYCDAAFSFAPIAFLMGLFF